TVPIWVKPEQDETPVKVEPGGFYPDPVDAIIIPSGANESYPQGDHYGEVYKVPGKAYPEYGVDITPDVKVTDEEIKGQGPIDSAALTTAEATGMGGWKEGDFEQKHPGWRKSFEKSRSPRGEGAGVEHSIGPLKD